MLLMLVDLVSIPFVGEDCGEVANKQIHPSPLLRRGLWFPELRL